MGLPYIFFNSPEMSSIKIEVEPKPKTTSVNNAKVSYTMRQGWQICVVCLIALTINGAYQVNTFFTESLAVSSKRVEKILIAPPKYRNLNNRIRTPVA